MSHHTIDQLIDLWKHEQLTAEQMIGQILQVLREQDQRLREIARRLPPDERARPSAAGRPEPTT